MFKTSLLFSALLALPASALTVTINDSDGISSNYITSSSGAPIPNASALIRLGYFNTSAQLPTWSDDLRSTSIDRINSALNSFVPFGEGLANLGDTPTASTGPRFTTRGGISSRINGGIVNIQSASGTPNSVSASGVPAGSRIFMLVYSDLNSTLSDGEELGVFSSSDWLIDIDSSTPTPLFTTDVDAGEIFRGSLGSLRLAPVGVPEPSATLLALGVVAMKLRRRR
jgi:hypothetical protein